MIKASYRNISWIIYLSDFKWDDISIVVCLQWCVLLWWMTEPNPGFSTIPGWNKIQQDLDTRVLFVTVVQHTWCFILNVMLLLVIKVHAVLF